MLDIKSNSASGGKHKKKNLKALETPTPKIITIEHFGKHPSIILSISS